MNENSGRLDIRYTVDNSELSKSTKSAEQSFDDVANAAQKSSERIDDAFKGKSIQELVTDSNQLKLAIAANKEEVREMSAELKELNKIKLNSTGKASFEADSDIKALQAKIELTKENTQAMNDEKNSLDKVIDSQKRVEKAMQQASAETEKQESVIVKLMGGQERYNTILGALPEPLKAAVTGIGTMTKAAIAFIATPLGAIIAAIVIGLKSLHTWFNSSADGQMALVKATGYFSGLMTQLKEIMIKIGEIIYKAFTDPKQAVIDLWDGIKTNLLNRLSGITEGFQAVGKIISSALKGKWEDVKQGALDYSNAIIKIGTGVDDVISKTAQWTSEIHKSAMKTKELKTAEEQLARDRNKWSLEEEKLQTKAQEAYDRAMLGKSDKDRTTALKEYQSIQDQIYNKQIEFQQQEVKIQDELNNLSTNAQEDNDALINKQRELQRLETERLRSKSRANRMLGSLGRKDENEVIAGKKKAQDEYFKFSLDQQKKAYDENIALQRATITDKDKLREFDLKQTLKAIEKEKEAYLSMYKTAHGEKATSPDVTIFNDRIKLATDQSNLEATGEKDKETVENTKRVRQELDDLKKEFETYEQERTRIKAEYTDKRKKIYEEDGKTLRTGFTQGNIEEAIKAEEEAIATIDLTIASREVAFKEWMDSIVTSSLEELNEALKATRTALDSNTDLKDTQKAVLRAKIDTLEKQIKIDEAKSTDQRAAENSKKRWDNTLKTMNEVQDTVNNIISSFNGLDDATKAALSAATNITGGIIGMIQGIESLAITGAEAIKGVERASVILAIIGAAIKIITSIMDLVNSAEKKHQQALEEVTKSKLDMQREYNKLLFEQNLLLKEATSIFGVDELTKSINAFDLYQKKVLEYKEALKGTKPTIAKIDFNGNDKDFVKASQNEFAKYASRVNAYKNGVGALGEIEVKTGREKTGFLGLGKGRDIYSSVLDVYDKLIDNEGKLNIERAKAIISTQQLSDVSKDQLQNLINLQEEAEKAQEELNSYLEGTFGGLGTSMMDAITNAIENGTDAWQEFGEAGSDVIKNLGKQLAYELFLSERFKKLQADLKSVYDKDRTGKTPDQIKKEIAEEQAKTIADFHKNSKDAINSVQDFLTNWNEEQDKVFGTTTGAQETGSASAKAITIITQDQANSLDGKMASIQSASYGILDGTNVIRDNTNVMKTDVGFIRERMDDLNIFTKKHLDLLAGIKENTNSLPNIAQTLKNIETNTSNL